MRLYMILSDDKKPDLNHGTFISLYDSKQDASRALDALFISEVVDMADDCELVNGEDYEYTYGNEFHSNFEQWWWIVPVVVG